MHLMIRHPECAQVSGVPSAAVVVAAFALLLIAPASSAATTISTVSSWTNQYIESFGDPNTATYRTGRNCARRPEQPRELHLLSARADRPRVSPLRLCVGWRKGHGSRPLRRARPAHQRVCNRRLSGRDRDDRWCAGDASDRYVIFFSVSKDRALDEGTHQGGEWAWVASSAYTGGSTVWMNNGYEPEEWTVPGEIEIFPGEFLPNAWERETAHDMEFSAVFGVSPAISSVTPSSVSEGTQVTITGANFSGATQVLFGDTPAGSFTTTAMAEITAVVPGGLSGAVDVRVITAAGSSATGAADRVTVSTPSTPSVSPPNITASAALTTSVAHCIAPSMRGLGIEAVEHALTARDCTLGRVAFHYNRLAKGDLVEQSLRQHMHARRHRRQRMAVTRGAWRGTRGHSARSIRDTGELAPLSPNSGSIAHRSQSCASRGGGGQSGAAQAAHLNEVAGRASVSPAAASQIVRIEPPSTGIRAPVM